MSWDGGEKQKLISGIPLDYSHTHRTHMPLHYLLPTYAQTGKYRLRKKAALAGKGQDGYSETVWILFLALPQTSLGRSLQVSLPQYINE